MKSIIISCSFPLATMVLLSACSQPAPNIAPENMVRVSIAEALAPTTVQPKEAKEQVAKVSLAGVVENKQAPEVAKNSLKLTASDITKSPLQYIVESALAYNQQTSSMPAVLQQRMAEEEAIRKSHWPTVQPAARWGSRTSGFIGLEGGYTLLDFGVSHAREKQGAIATQIADVDMGLEQRYIVADVISEVGAIAALSQKIYLLNQALHALKSLSHYAEARLAAGFINESEPLALNLRIAELQSEQEAREVEMALKIKLLSAKLLVSLDKSQIPHFSSINASLAPQEHDVNHALVLQKSQLNVAMAEAKLKQTERERYPQINLEGSLGVSRHSNGQNHAIGVALKSPTSLFSGASNVRAAEAALLATQKEQQQILVKLSTESERIMLEQTRLLQNQQTLRQLEKKSQSSIALFKQQFDVATATLSDGLSAYRTLLQTQQQLVDLEAELINLKAAAIRISNSKIFNDDNTPLHK